MSNKIMFALMALAASGAAHALTFTSMAGAPDPGVSAGETVLVDFNSTMLPDGYSLTGGYDFATGTTSSAAAPAGDSTRYLYVSSALSTNTATLTTAFDLSKVSFYWGSIDTYNSVDILGADGVILRTIGGAMLPPANGDQGAGITNRRVTFTADAGEAITGLRFTSTGVAFEIDDIAGTALTAGTPGSVPEPASWALMLAGFGMVGATVRRRRETMVSVAA